MRHWVQGILLVVYTAVMSCTVQADEAGAVYAQVSRYVAEPDASAITEDILDASAMYGVDPILAAAVFTTESGFDQSAGSSAGAIGIAQLMPDTAAGLGVNPYDMTDNIYGGVAYLGEMLYRYQDWDDPYVYAEAAYNAGPGAVDAAGGVPGYAETMAYVDKVEAERQAILADAGLYDYEPPAEPVPEPGTDTTTDTAPSPAKPAVQRTPAAPKQDVPPPPAIRVWPPSAKAVQTASNSDTSSAGDTSGIALYRR